MFGINEFYKTVSNSFANTNIYLQNVNKNMHLQMKSTRFMKFICFIVALIHHHNYFAQLPKEMGNIHKVMQSQTVGLSITDAHPYSLPKLTFHV